MDENERKVRANWELVREWVRDLDSYGDDQFNVSIYLSAEDARWWRNEYKRWQKINNITGVAAVWAAAAAFTDSRNKEIRQIQEEIEFVRLSFLIGGSEAWRETHERTVSRLEAELARLQQGMKKEQQ